MYMITRYFPSGISLSTEKRSLKEAVETLRKLPDGARCSINHINYVVTDGKLHSDTKLVDKYDVEKLYSIR